MTLKTQLEQEFGLTAVECSQLNVPVNDVFEVNASGGRFALKVYNAQSRTRRDVEWEFNLIKHLVLKHAPVAKPVCGRHGYVQTVELDNQQRVAILFEWAPGKKPTPDSSSFLLLGKAAAEIHEASDTFVPSSSREGYDVGTLIDEQLSRMRALLSEARIWDEAFELGERLKKRISVPSLDSGICHMDLTLDNVHVNGDEITVFDFDSAGECWRAIEPHRVLRLSDEYFAAWLEGYRSVRPFSKDDERAVAAFAVIGDLRIAAWNLGVARSSRGIPLLTANQLPGVVAEWLEWERTRLGD